MVNIMSDDNSIYLKIVGYFSVIIFLLFCGLYQFNAPISELTIGTIIFSLLWMLLFDLIIIIVILIIALLINA